MSGSQLSASSLHWCSAYVGRRYEPDGFNCWALVREIMRERAGINLPEAGVSWLVPNKAALRAFQSSALRAGWNKVSAPRELDAVLMTSATRPCHVGIYLDGGRVLHASPPAVTAEQFGSLRARGLSVIGFYRHEYIDR